jgi:hypothetical protein
MKKIVEYKVVKFTSDKELVNVVNSLIKEGWQPLGGVSIANEIMDHCQAMVKYEK